MSYYTLLIPYKKNFFFVLRCCYVCVLSCVWLFVTPWTVACQAPLPWNFPGKNTGDPGDLPDPGIKPMSLASSTLSDGFFATAPSGKTTPPPPLSLLESVWSFQGLLLHIIRGNQNRLIYFCYQGQDILNTLLNIFHVRVSFPSGWY